MKLFNNETATDLEKLNNVVAVSLDDIKAEIDQIVDNFDIDNVRPERLNIIGNMLGYKLGRETDPDFKRRSLKTAIDFYKSKGTPESIRILFFTLGFDVEVIPLWTADFQEQIEIAAPYIRVATPVLKHVFAPGYYDVHVLNPDEQGGVLVGAVQFL